MSTLNVLADYARLSNPSSSLPPSVLLFDNAKTITIFDAYPKAKFHFLVIPKADFPLEDPAERASLDSLRQLLASDHSKEVLEAIRETVEEVTWMIRDEMEKTYGWSWGVNAGFHAEESMRHVHCHCISDEFVSDRLKVKKHWNSFRPDLGFWIPLEDVLDEAPLTLRRPSFYTDLLKQPLEDPRTSQTFRNMPELKSHLQARWDEAAARRNKAPLGE